MTTSFVIRVETPVQLQVGDYLIVTIEDNGRARYKHLPAALAKMIQGDHAKVPIHRKAAGPVLRGAAAQKLESDLLDALRKPATGAQLCLKLPQYRSGQIYSRLSRMVTENKIVSTRRGRSATYAKAEGCS